MRKTVLLLSICIVLTGTMMSFADSNADEKCRLLHINDCIEMAKLLRNGDDNSARKVYDKLISSEKWTMLSEIKLERSDEKDFKLNSCAINALSAKLNNDNGSSPGVFKDGTHPFYNICFIEKLLKAGEEHKYILPKRIKNESIAIVECREGDITVSVDGKNLKSNDGVFITESKKENIEITVRNCRNKAVSFIIINEHK